MASLVAFMDRKLPIEIIRLLKMKRLHPKFSVPDQINELDIFKLDPSELPGRSQINSDEQAWPFFSEPYKNVKGKQTHLTNGRGNWEKTGNDGEVRDKSTGKRIGGKKNYVYYKRGASPKQKIKTDWVMHEYYVDDDDSRYKEDFVFRYVEKNPMGKRNTSTPDDDQPSHSLASHAETYAEKTSTEVESQQPSTHCLGNGFLEVEPELQSNQSLVPDTGNYVSATNTSTMEVEPRLLSDHSLCYDQRNPFAPITSSMVQPQLLPNHNLGFDPRYKFADDTSPVEAESRLPSNDNLVSDDQSNHFAPIATSMVMMHSTEFDHSMEFDPRYHFVPNTSSMLLPHQNLDSLMVGPQLLSNHNMAFDPMNHSAPCTSSMVGPQLLSNQNMVFDPINHSASITSSMQVEPRLLSNQNLVSDYSRDYFVPNTSSMVAHDQLLANHNFFSDPRNHFAPNSCLMGHPQLVAELFAQFTAQFGRYLLNHSLVSAPQWPINPQQGSYSPLYSNGTFGNNCTLSSSQFHGGLEDAWIAQRNFQDIYPEEAIGQDSSY